MIKSKIESLRKQVREMGHSLAMSEKRGLRSKDHVAKKIALCNMILSLIHI